MSGCTCGAGGRKAPEALAKGAAAGFAIRFRRPRGLESRSCLERARWLAPSPAAVADRGPFVPTGTPATDRRPMAGAATLMTDRERDGLRRRPLKGPAAPLLASASCRLHSIRFARRQPSASSRSLKTPPRRSLRTPAVRSIAHCALVKNCGWLSQWTLRLSAERLHAVWGCPRAIVLGVANPARRLLMSVPAPFTLRSPWSLPAPRWARIRAGSSIVRPVLGSERRFCPHPGRTTLDEIVSQTGPEAFQ
jgi:hypothetical protein